MICHELNPPKKTNRTQTLSTPEKIQTATKEREPRSSPQLQGANRNIVEFFIHDLWFSSDSQSGYKAAVL